MSQPVVRHKHKLSYEGKRVGDVISWTVDGDDQFKVSGELNVSKMIKVSGKSNL